MDELNELNEEVAALAPEPKEEEEEEPLNQNLETSFAIAWSENQGSYSEGIAKKITNFIKLQGLKVDTVLDVCCGSANFLKVMQDNGKKCTGTEILDSYIEYDKRKYKDIEFIKTEEILGFDDLGQFDLITCNHDVVNFLPNIESWGRFFRMAYRHLNNGGLLVFDFYTKRKLEGWNEIYYDENEKLDYIKSVSTEGENSTKITNIYYINLNPEATKSELSAMDREYSLSNHEIKYKRTEDTSIEYYFNNNDIFEEIKRAGYRYLITTDGSFTPIKSVDDQNRLHVIAIKREK